MNLEEIDEVLAEDKSQEVDSTDEVMHVTKMSAGRALIPPTPEPQVRDGTGSPGYGSPGQRFWPGRVGSRVCVSHPVFDPVLSFNMRVYRGVVSAE